MSWRAVLLCKDEHSEIHGPAKYADFSASSSIFESHYIGASRLHPCIELAEYFRYPNGSLTNLVMGLEIGPGEI